MRFKRFFAAAACVLLLAMAASAENPSTKREFCVNLWDWTAPCRDLPTFKLWAADMKKIGVTRIEISAPWNLLEPKPGEYDLSFITDRLAVAKSFGLGLRVRINSYYGGATPSWYTGDFWQDINGKAPVGTPLPVSVTDERFWAHYGPLCTKIAAAVKGEDVYLNAFIGVHAELKWSDWWSYDPSTLARWQRDIKDRPQWLIDVAGDAELPARPPVPQATNGIPDNSPISKAWIAFRQQVWRDAMARFRDACRAGDAHAKISSPLGESFRRESAAMSNLDFYGLSRGVDQVVHSYDFYWHPKDDAWHAAAAVASFRGITGIDNIVFEFDGPNLVENLGYDEAHQVRIAEAAISQGAGLQAANYSGGAGLPSTYPVLSRFGGLIASATTLNTPPKNETILLFVSKWANYCYREKAEWLHDAQFGAWRMLMSHGLHVRFICEDNLVEDLSKYRGLYVAFSPPELIPAKQRAMLESLQHQLPSIVELNTAPTTRPTKKDGTLAYRWLRGDREQADRELIPLLSRFK